MEDETRPENDPILHVPVTPETAEIPDRLFFRIGDVAELIGVKPYVLRYWETEFAIVSPEKSRTGHRVYRRNDVETLMTIKHLLYKERYSIEGARRRINDLRKQGQLKSFKDTQVLARVPEDDAGRERRFRQIRAVALELSELIQKPLRDIFKY